MTRLSRERKAELAKNARHSAVRYGGGQVDALAHILAELIEAMPEEAMEAECNCPDNGRDGHHPLCIVGPKPGSDEERQKAWDQGHAAGFRQGVRHALAIASRPA